VSGYEVFTDVIILCRTISRADLSFNQLSIEHSNSVERTPFYGEH